MIKTLIVIWLAVVLVGCAAVNADRPASGPAPAAPGTVPGLPNVGAVK